MTEKTLPGVTCLGAIASSVLLFAVYVAGAEACHVFVIPPSQSAVAWLPSGRNFALFVRARRIPALWPGWLAALWLGQFVVVRFNDGLPMVTALLWSTANVVVPLTAARRSPSGCRCPPPAATPHERMDSASVIRGGRQAYCEADTRFAAIVARRPRGRACGERVAARRTPLHATACATVRCACGWSHVDRGRVLSVRRPPVA